MRGGCEGVKALMEVSEVWRSNWRGEKGGKGIRGFCVEWLG